MARWLVVIAAMALSACVGGPAQRYEARFDFGPQTAAPAGELGLADVEVTMPSWLDGDAMQYRLLYAQASQRLDYAESRWVASPAELLRQALMNRLGVAGKGRCRLLIDMDEFVQVYDSPASSHFRLDARATLVSGQEVVGSRSFSATRSAPTLDARGGVAAASMAVQEFGGALATWLAERDNRCRSG